MRFLRGIVAAPFWLVGALFSVIGAVFLHIAALTSDGEWDIPLGDMDDDCDRQTPHDREWDDPLMNKTPRQ